VPGRSQSEIMRSFSSSANLQKRLRSEEWDVVHLSHVHQFCHCKDSFLLHL
jgi:hypothetical protein